MNISMESSDTLLTCGRFTSTTKTFNEQSNIEQVKKYAYDTFGSDLPKSYRIVYYDTEMMSLVDLDEKLRNGLSPFQLNTSTGVQDTSSTNNSIHLFILDNSSRNSDMRSQTETQANRQTIDDADESLFSEERQPASNLSGNSLLTNDTSDDNCEYLSRTTNDTRPRIVMLNTNQQLISSPSYIKPFNRLFFSLDVKPKQRDIYKSDQFSVREDKPNGRIARVQGVKKPQQKMLQVLPKLRIPAEFHHASNVSLLVAVVSEQIEDGMRIWYKHPHKGFLPEGYTKDTECINPIEFDLSRCNLMTSGDFELSLQMVTKWNKSQNELEEFYRLDEKQFIRVHGAAHDASSPRLFCVLQRNGETDWSTFCVSNFIQSPKPSKHRSSSAVSPRTCSPKRKRLK